MDVASGDAVIVMDADLQDSPEVVGQMIDKWKEGYEVVCGRRLSRGGESSKTFTASLVARWASTIILVSFLSGINMIMTGIMGLYVGRIHAEVKRRPLYVVSEKTGFDRAAQPLSLIHISEPTR